MDKLRRLAGIAVVLGLCSTLAQESAQACGGFFCARTPIDQSGEYILFSFDDNGIRAYIQIQYQGKADDFAWVLPVMTKPTKIGVGVQQTFTAIMGRTLPQFRIDWSQAGACNTVLADAARGAGGAAGSPFGGVNVLDQGEVGPYNYVVLQASEADKLKKWLDDNGFVQPASAEPALAHYVKQGFVFVAIKLKRGADTGEIQPLVLDLGQSEACVPLVLTRIAATADMPVYVLMLGKHRAVPRNWFEVEVNPKRIDWFRGGANYRMLVTAAINEAAGRAFVTEYAGDTSLFRNALWAPGQYDLSRLQGVTDPVRFVQLMLQIGLPRDPIIQSLLRKYIPMPDSVRMRGVTEQMFYNALSNYARDLMGQPFDAAGFIKELDERVVKPLREAQEMLDHQPYLTRMFTTVSPDEMTRDPLFDFNPDLKPVSNVHVAKASGTCTSDGRVSNVTLVFENGDAQSIPGTFFRFQGPMDTSYAQAEPAARRVQLVGPQGPPIEIARSRVAVFDQNLDSMDPKVVRELARAEAPASESSGGCSCALLGSRDGAASAAVPTVLLLAALGRRLRRRKSA